ncbi:MAG: serine/threonine-protein kinase [Planctomycetota bacterium]
MVALEHLDERKSLSASSTLSSLTQDQQNRLTTLLDDYLASLEMGQSPDADALANEHPDIQNVFRAYLSKLDALYGVAVGFPSVGDSEPLREMAKGRGTLGEFKIRREIARGGMGIVYEAWQESLSRTVAIKLLPMSLMIDQQQVARFKNESHAAGLLHHPHIVPVYEVGTEQGLHYYAMQFIDGISLDECVGDRPFHENWKQIRGWMICVARALHAAHETGVIHRDIKPSNLLLDRENKVWITDFGLARCQSEASLTNSGDLVGTVRYMSPEQARGKHALVDGRADLYSLAATTYELLTAQPAHLGEEAPEILQAIADEEVIPLRQFRPDLPVDLETVLTKALSKNRDDRYETVAAFADELQRVVNGKPTHARPATPVDHLVRFAIEHRNAVAVGLLIGLLGLIGFATSTAVIASWKQESDLNANRARENEQLARGAVERLGSQMAELLSEIPSADSVRRRLLSDTLEYHKTFVAHADEDPQLKEDLAITFGKMGALHQELGESQRALVALRQSEALYRDLAKADPTHLLAWSTSQNNLGQALVTKGQSQDAMELLAQAIQIQRKLVAEQPSPGTRLALATTLNNLGLLLAKHSATQHATRSYQEAIDLLQVDGDNGANPAIRGQLATLLSNLSGLFTKESPAESIALAKQALVIQADALERDPDNPEAANQVIATLNTLGASQSASSKHAQAIETLQHAAELGEQLLVRWPHQPNYRRDALVSFNHLGLAYCRAEKLSEATSAFESALNHGRTLAETLPDEAEIQSMLGGVLNNLAFLQQQRGERVAAHASYDAAVEAQSKAVQLAPGSQRYRQQLDKQKENRRKLSRMEATS